ncbi:excisionase family DNA-binding protein [Microbacterium xylanilyticum]
MALVGSELLTVQAAAARLSLAPYTIRRLIADGALRAYKVGPEPVGKLRDVRPLRIPADAVEALLHPVIGSAA